MMDFVKVKGVDGLVRDTSTKAIINTNKTEFERYIAQRDINMNRQKQIDQHEASINSIRDDIDEIKTILQTLITIIKK